VTQSSLAEQRAGAVAGSPSAAEARVPPNIRAGCGLPSAADASSSEYESEMRGDWEAVRDPCQRDSQRGCACVTAVLGGGFELDCKNLQRWTTDNQ
jgi:hypothetical protein